MTLGTRATDIARCYTMDGRTPAASTPTNNDPTMALTDRINADMKDALRGGRKLELETLRTIRAAILEFEKRGTRSAMTEDDEIAILQSAAKKRREAIEQYRLAGRDDLVEQESAELEIVRRYLPAQLDDTAIDALIREAISAVGATGAKDFGKVMGTVMQAAKGRADGAKIQARVRAALEALP
jgi:uncharacterized protein YqeY